MNIEIIDSFGQPENGLLGTLDDCLQTRGHKTFYYSDPVDELYTKNFFDLVVCHHALQTKIPEYFPKDVMAALKKDESALTKHIVSELHKTDGKVPIYVIYPTRQKDSVTEPFLKIGPTVKCLYANGYGDISKTNGLEKLANAICPA
jgi:hypothetical protein